MKTSIINVKYQNIKKNHILKIIFIISSKLQVITPDHCDEVCEVIQRPAQNEFVFVSIYQHHVIIKGGLKTKVGLEFFFQL